MIELGLGQAILGGIDHNDVLQNKIYHMTCSENICMVSKLNIELSVPRAWFVAIPIPDRIAGCISESEFPKFHEGFCIFAERNQEEPRGTAL